MADATESGTAESTPPIAGVLEDIKKAEAKVREMLKEAAAHKERTIAEAKREIIAIREQYAKEIEGATERMMSETASKIETDRKKISESAESKAIKARAQASARISQAKDLLLKDLMRAIDDQA